MLIEVGPATLVLAGEGGGEVFPFERQEIEAYVARILREIGEALPILRQKAYRIKKIDYLPEPAKRMIRAVKAIDEATLTPMAAVAGAVADLVKEHLSSSREIDLLSVNNGGDISICNRSGRLMRIGIGDIDSRIPTPYVLKVEGLRSFGVATSGFGGRSFTLGLADIVSVLADSAALADAAATLIANRTRSEAAGVVRRRARELDPLTDIPDELVTVDRGCLNTEAVVAAVINGKEEAEKLKSAGVIRDAVVILKGYMMHTLDEKSTIKLEVSHGSEENRDRC
jgi:ApbE superfamily uncharacterized protein (UPF0280 family)